MSTTTVEATRVNIANVPSEGQLEAQAIKERYKKPAMTGADELSDEEKRRSVRGEAQPIVPVTSVGDIPVGPDDGSGLLFLGFGDGIEPPRANITLPDEPGEALTQAEADDEPDDIDKGVQASATKLVQSTLTLSPPQVFPEGEKWQRSPAIAAAARDIAMAESMAANGGRFAAYWREKGGSSKGNPVLGGVKLTSGMEKDVTGLDFYIWLAADHLKNASEHEIKAQIYHQLAHIAANDETGGFGLVDHDFSDFVRGVELYGITSHSLAKAKAVLEQAKLKLS